MEHWMEQKVWRYRLFWSGSYDDGNMTMMDMTYQLGRKLITMALL